MNCIEIAALQEIFKDYPVKKYKKGEIIVHEGDSIYEIGFIKSGFVRLYRTTITGEEFTINFFKPLYIVTSIFAYLDKNCDYSMEAVTDVEIWRAPKDEIINKIRSDPKNVDLMARKYMNLLRATMNGMSNLMMSDALDKIGVVLLSLAKQYGEPKCNKEDCKNTEIPFDLTQTILASIAGTTRETVNKVINNLEKEGLLKRRGKRIVIPDVPKLRAFIEK